MKIEKDKDLKTFNYYDLNVTAKFFVELKTRDDFVEAFAFVEKEKLKKFFVFGEGSNIVFKREVYDGLVMKVSNTFLKWNVVGRKTNHNNSVFRPTTNQVEVGAGKNLDIFLAVCQKKGIFDIQSLSSIPGSVGAGVFGNVGAFGREIKNFVFGVWVFNFKKREFIFFKNQECGFSYRDSFFKKNRDRFLVFSVVFDFSKKFKREMDVLYNQEEYFSLEHFAKKHNLGKIKNSEIRKNIKKIRKGIYPDIKKFPNVGSTFGNTELSKSQLKKLLKKYPDTPNWEQRNGKVKIPTAYIFDKVLDLNGKVFGNIKIDQKRPLFFLNLGGATGKEFFSLCQKIKKMVKKELDIEIKEEIFFVD